MVTNTKGFTLIELFLALGIIGILSMVVYPSFSRYLPEKHLKEAAAQLYLDLHEAKSNAVINRQNIRVVFDGANAGYSIQNAAGNTLKSVSLSGFKSGIVFGPGPATADIGGNSFDPDYITYNPSSSVTFNAQGMTNLQGYVYLTNITNSVCYAIGTPSRSGYIRMRKTGSGEWPND